MSKRKIVLIIIITLLLLFFLVIGIKTILRLRVLNIVLDKANENIKKDNYSLSIAYKAGNVDSTTTAYYRNGIGRYVADNGVYTWTDGKDAYLIDEEKQTIYVLSIDTKSEMLVSSDMFAYYIPGYNCSFWEKLKLAGNLSNKFSTDKIDEEECYKIAIQEDKYVKTTWISKKSLNPVKATMVFPSGEVLEYTYDLRFTATKITSIEMPNIENFKVIDYDSQEVIMDEFKYEDDITNTTNTTNSANTANVTNTINNTNTNSKTNTSNTTNTTNKVN